MVCDDGQSREANVSYSRKTSLADSSDDRFSQVDSLCGYPFHFTRYCARLPVPRCASIDSTSYTSAPFSNMTSGGGRSSIGGRDGNAVDLHCKISIGWHSRRDEYASLQEGRVHMHCH